MLYKFALFLIVLFVIYTLFFKRKNAKKEQNNQEFDTLIECLNCKTFVSIKEAIKKNREYFCSAECANTKRKR